MPSVIVPAALLQAVWVQEDQPVENTFWYRKTGAWAIADLQALCNTYITWATANDHLMTDVCSLQKCIATDMSSLGGFEATVTPISPVAGTNTTGQLPNNATFALKRETGLRGRKNRGRIFLIGLPKNALGSDQQTLTEPAIANYVAAYDGLLTGQLGSNSAHEVIAHRSTSTVTDVLNYTAADIFVDSQRRRLPGHNRHH